jgi:hypothetical protein
VGAKLRGVGMRVASAMLPLVRALVAQIAVVLLKATGWELNALKAWRRIPGKKVGCPRTARQPPACLSESSACRQLLNLLPAQSRLPAHPRPAPLGRCPPAVANGAQPLLCSAAADAVLSRCCCAVFGVWLR